MMGARRLGRAFGPVFLAAFLTMGCVSDLASRQAMRLDRAGIKRLVASEAVRMGVSTSLALAVAHAESNFDPRALSSKGARGVMQIMPGTAMGEYAIRPDRLWEPRLNIRLGLHFLGRILRRYRGRVDLALSYYNGGSGVGDLPRARVLPATAFYVSKVLRLRAKYRARLRRGQV
jgi:soluble lytic murein transglycosylase-like protein